MGRGRRKKEGKDGEGEEEEEEGDKDGEMDEEEERGNGKKWGGRNEATINFTVIIECVREHIRTIALISFEPARRTVGQ